MSYHKDWKEPSKAKYKIWHDKLLKLEAAHKAIDIFDDSKSKEWSATGLAFRQHYNSCPECGGSNTSVRNHDMMWHDGDVVCDDCNTYVRGWDAG